MSAQMLELPALARVFKAGFSEYVVPLQMTEAALDDLFAESLIEPADPDGVSTFLEGRAQRD